MYQAVPGAAAGTAVLGVQFAAAEGAAGEAAARLAQATLPVTGIAFGLYLALALGLIVLGVLLRWVGTREA